jgi:hypothetical protein
MKKLYIQIQPRRSPGLDAEEAVDRLRNLGATAVVKRGEDVVPYINVLFRAADVKVLWEALQEQLRADPALAGCSIVCSEGERSWDDYRLLHHFDPRERLDEVE